MSSKFSRVGLSLVLVFAMVLSGCSTDWMGEADAIVAALIPATSNVVALVAVMQGKEASAGDLQLVQNVGAQVGTDLQIIRSLIAGYEKADETMRPGILAQIQNSIAAVQMNLQGLLQGLHIKDPATQTKVTAVIGIVLAEVQSLQVLVPLVKAEAASGKNPALNAATNASFRTGHPWVRHPQVPLTAGQFVSSYNATLTARTGNAAVDQAAGGLRIHLHSSAARIASGGLLR
jgi:hypothetical protein